MKIYFLRHAPTAPNLTGTMVKDYSQEPIVGSLPDEWQEDIGCHIPKIDVNLPIMSSPVKRCVQTSELVFKMPPMMTIEELNEFDCKELNDLKFWEITQEEFERIVPLRAVDMEHQVDAIFELFKSMHEALPELRGIFCISHGMVIRYIYHYLTNNKNITPYEVINSKGFSFYNLDLLEYDLNTNLINVYHNRKHITHF